MKSALLVFSIAAALLATSPAIACRAYTVAPRRPVPSVEERVVFTAVLESRERDEWSAFSANLRVQQRLLGEAPEQVVVSRGGVGYATEDGFVLGMCIRYLPFEPVLAHEPLGSELVVVATRRHGFAVDVLDIALADTDRGRELRALANP
jgi:hypothetical protein